MKNIILLAALGFLFLFSCNSDDSGSDGGASEPFQLSGLDGKSQKGPYLIGSSITIFELNEEYKATGLSFAEEIVDNQGSFSIGGTDLASPFVEMRANGFYFNEVLNDNSTAALTLNAIVDLTDKSNININILTALEKKRVEFLIADGMPFAEAKSQALAEVLGVFEIQNANIDEAELLDITQAGDPNAILLAVSTILQGYDGVADLSELISSISSDLETDGVLDNANLCTQLKSNATLLRLSEIRSNMEGWLSDQGIGGTVADFEKFVNQFIANSPCESDASILYPESGKHGANILSATHQTLPLGEYSMAATLKEGSTLRVKVEGNNWAFAIGQTNTGWDVGDWDPATHSRIFTSNRTGELDFKIRLTTPFPNGPISNKLVITVYENDATNASWVKNLSISGFESGFAYPDFGDFGGNLLANFAFVENPMDGNSFPVSVHAIIPDGESLELEMSGTVWSLPTPLEGDGWEILENSGNTLRLGSTRDGAIDFKLILSPPCDPNESSELIVDVYENGDAIEAFTLTEFIEGNPISGEPMFFPGQFGENIFDFFNSNVDAGDYSLAVNVEGDFKVVLTGDAWMIPNPIQGYGWDVMPYNTSNSSQTFTTNSNDADILIQLIGGGSSPKEIMVEYFVGCATTPSESFSIFVD